VVKYLASTGPEFKITIPPKRKKKDYSYFIGRSLAKEEE
jgi:hypothetical protein